MSCTDSRGSGAKMDNESLQNEPPGKPRRKDRARLLVASLPGLAAALLFILLHELQPSIMSEASNLVFDFYQRLAPRPYQPVPVKVIDIDDASLARLGQWPWPRTDLARLTDRLAKAGAAAIAFDAVFSEPDRTSPSRIAALLRREPSANGSYDAIAAMPDHDVLFGKALASAPSVIGYFFTNEPNKARPLAKAGVAVSGTSALDRLPAYRGSIPSLPAIEEGATGGGFVSIPGGGDGIVRMAPLLSRIGDTIYPALSLEALRVAQGASTILIKTTTGSGEFGAGQRGIVRIKVGTFELPTTPAGALWMYYRRPRADDSIPAWKVLTGALSDAEMKAAFQGKIVFVGTGAEGLRDLVATPLGAQELGASVHAQAIEQIILKRFLKRPDWAHGIEFFVLVVLGVGLALGLPSVSALRGGIVAGALLVLSALGSWFAFKSHALLVDPTYAAGEVVSVYVAGTLYAFWREERARAYIHRAFDRYLSPDLVNRIAADPSSLELGGEERDMTVMFCDIRGFSRISEKLTPRQLIAFLIEFLTPTTDVLLAHKATIDKFIGDAILAFWNAPLDDPDHARNAALGVLALKAKVAELNKVNAGAAGKVWPGVVRIGIGLDSGPCCVGNIGSAQRLNYSLIGDTVNLASRIEGLTKVYGVAIAMGDGTAKKLAGFATLEIDRVRVVGRDTPEPLHALLGPPELSAEPSFQVLKSAQQTFLAAYRAQNWDEAEGLLRALREHAGRFELDALMALYAGRISAFRQVPPPADWDGVFDAQHK